MHMIKGQSISLRKTTLKDAKKSAQWLNNPKVIEFLEVTKPVTYESRRKFLKERLEDPSEVNFSIIEKATEEYIGNVYIYNIDTEKGEGELGVFIGETRCWGKGYAQETINLIQKHAYRNLKLKKIYAKCIETNKRAYNCYLKLGFLKEGQDKKALEKTDILYSSKDNWIKTHE